MNIFKTCGRVDLKSKILIYSQIYMHAVLQVSYIYIYIYVCVCVCVCVCARVRVYIYIYIRLPSSDNCGFRSYSKFDVATEEGLSGLQTYQGFTVLGWLADVAHFLLLFGNCFFFNLFIIQL